MEIGLRSKSLPRFRILQIGDVHYPDWTAAPAAMDVKTKQISTEILDNLQVDGFQNLLRTISRNEFIDACDAVAFVGDFTTRGDQDQLERALRHLAALFRINPHTQSSKFHAVPGNHDVARDLAKSLGMMGKFEPMAKLVKELGFSALPVQAPVSIRPGDPTRPIQLLMTNTTLGSWERVGLPDKVVAWIDEVAAAEGSGREGNQAGGDGGAIPILDPSTYYDQLDTPFISKKSLIDIKHLVEDDDEMCLPCLVGHHNILPQATPRVSPFGELLNQGEFRTTLLSLNRTVLYLHGHIHTDPVEIISSPSNAGSKIVSIGAPTLSEGVNVIDIFFSRSGDPIGMAISPLRVASDGQIRVVRQMDISLRSNAFGLVGQLAELVTGALNSGRKSWAELRKNISEVAADDDELEAVSLELVWGGLVRIANQSAPRQRWFLELNR